MKFTFQADLDFQRQAIDAVTGLFKGQESLTSQFTVQAHAALSQEGTLDVAVSDVQTVGYGNRLRLSDEGLLRNLREVQDRAGLHPEDELTSRNFTVEMETGTGKTYVYLRTIYELHDLYGFTKFVIVVPSVAISEGVRSSIEMLREHLGSLYGNPPVQYFPYSGTNVSRLRSFATSSGIEIMIVTAAAINKASARIHKPAEELDNEIPMDLLRATSPIVIVDEPQSVYGDDGNPRKKKGAGRRAIEGDRLPPKAAAEKPYTPAEESLAKGMEATAVLRYSATHPRFDQGNLVYRLDAIGAYERQLVKQIEVDSLVTEAGGVKPYVKLVDVTARGRNISARAEVDVDNGRAIARKIVNIRDGDNLADITGRELYRELTVDGVSAVPADKYIAFTDNTRLNAGETTGAEISEPERARQMIRQTIRQHLRKELDFRTHGRAIKVLSLFFVDSVAKYRTYENGEERPGAYARIFEEEYAKVAAEPEFQTLIGADPFDAVARGAHQGYFSIDRGKGGGERFVDTVETNDKGRQAAGRAYEQIMKSKTWLTTPGTPIRFIFSHSALQEGWDNPNVFQICVLRNMGTERWRRQSIGRGLRLCVDGSGDRVPGFDINRLTVIANESYEEFAEQLQKELADDLGVQFGVVTVDGFARLSYKPEGGDDARPIGESVGNAIFTALLQAGYIDHRGKVQDSLRTDVQSDIAPVMRLVGEQVGDPNATVAVTRLIKRLVRPIDIKKAGTRVTVPVLTERLESPEFTALWDRLKHRTRYRVTVPEDKLRRELVKAIREVSVPDRKGEWFTDVVDRIDQSGLVATTARARRVDITFADSEDLPDILSVLADRTDLTRRTLATVLTESGTLRRFAANPQAYVDAVTTAIETTKTRLQIDGLHYEMVDGSRPDDERRFPLSIFEEADLAGYTGRGGNIVMDDDGEPVSFAAKSPYKFLVVDSAIEKDFALRLRQRDDIKTFVKLPDTFFVPTPQGDYRPDWAVMARRPDGSRYIVFETKSSANIELLPELQKGKVEAARKHFDRVRVDARVPDLEYEVVSGMTDADAILDRTEDPVE